jgi:hypothetical protein
VPELLVPAYVHWSDEATWARIAAARPAVVVINPNNGPDPSQQEPYARIAKELREARPDVRVLGYVWCDYFDRGMRSVRAEARNYEEFFAVDGIFWDGTPTTDDRTTRRRVTSLNHAAFFSVFNCGAPVASRWFGMVPDAVFVTFEGPASAYRVGIPGDLQVGHSVCHLVHSAGPGYVLDVVPEVAYHYATAGELPNPWCTF